MVILNYYILRYVNYHFLFVMNDLIRAKILTMMHVPFEQRLRQASTGESNVYTTTWLHWVYLGMAVFSVAFVSLKFFEQKQRR